MYLMTRDHGIALNADLAGPSALAQYLASRSPLAFRILARRNRRFQVLLKQALDLARDGRVDEATDQLESMKRSFRKMPDLYGHLGWIYLSTGHPMRAAANYRQLLKLQPENAEARDLLDRAMVAAGETVS